MASVLLAMFAWAWLSGCSMHYRSGLALEAAERWEEASIQYHLAVINDPGVSEYREALTRANKVVARDNMERYKTYLAAKEFRKAYARLSDASRQDPELASAQAERKKWLRVLVVGQVVFRFEEFHAGVGFADKMRLMARLNTPNPGESLDAEINIDNGFFFVEDLLYDRPEPLLTYYSLQAVGVELVHGKSFIQQFTTTDFLRFINYRSPVLEGVEGTLTDLELGDVHSVGDHRRNYKDPLLEALPYQPQPNPKYRLNIKDSTIGVETGSERSDFTPRFLYINQQDQRMLVDFGRYEVRSRLGTGSEWQVRRLPLTGADHFSDLSRNIALQPYLYYQGRVFAYSIQHRP
ncbi:MAG: hypothetical protein OEW39_01230 [Deltaproteobacteria bacterium]|nr:hypothetical protein [Deltaproteobacteria bacterium]